MGRQPKFTPIVLSFDKDGYSRTIHEIQKTANDLNTAKEEVLNYLEMTLSDDHVQKYIIEKENIRPFAETLYSDQLPKIRGILRDDIIDEFDVLHGNKYLYDEVNKYRPYLSVKNGNIIVDAVKLEALKPKFEHTIETERAKTAYELHLLAFETIQKLIEMGDENRINLTANDFFDHYNKDGILKFPKIDYNRI